MASSNQRERELARAKHERQKVRRDSESRKQDRTKIIAIVLIVSMVILAAGGFLLGRLFS